MRYFSTWSSRPYIFENEEIRERHARIVSTQRKAVVLTELRDALDEFYDTSSLDCVPRSKYKPEMLIEPCRKYERGGKMPAVHWTDLRLAVSRVKAKMVRKSTVTPLKLEEVPFDPSTNSGLPYLSKKADVYDVTLERAKACEQGACPPPMVMFSRGKNLDVVRPVLAGPFEWQLLEGKFFYPLQDYFLSFSNPYLVGVHSCTTAAKINELSYAPYVLCMDYSGYDGSLSGLLIGLGFSVLRACLSLTESEEQQWKAIQTYFVTSPIVCPDQRVYTGRDHGVPSGSMFTQMIDSVCNMIIVEYVALRTHTEIGKYYVVGDDSVVALSNSVSIDDIVSAAAEIGINVHPTKSEILDTSKEAQIHFLGHTYRNGLPERPVEETLQKLLTPERLKKEIFSKDEAVRVKYYLERIRAYQEDTVNREAWNVLRRLEIRLRYPGRSMDIINKQSRMSMDRHMFCSPETVERDRWDPQRRQLRESAGKRLVRAAVYWA